MAAPTSSNFAWASALLGPARCGKTTFVKRYLRSCRDGEEERKPLNYLYVELKQDKQTEQHRLRDAQMDERPTPGLWNASAANQPRRQHNHSPGSMTSSSTTRRTTSSIAGRGGSVTMAPTWFNGLLNEAEGCHNFLLVGYDQLGSSDPHQPRRWADASARFRRFPAHEHTVEDDLVEFRLVLVKAGGPTWGSRPPPS